MKIINNQTVPDFTTKDVYGNEINISDFRGQKVHLNFYRFAACPFCNLHFHAIEKLAEDYKAHNVKLISIFESSADNVKAQMGDERFYATVIPDTQSDLYRLFDLDRSVPGLLKYLFFKGGLANAIKGAKLYTQKVKKDGHSDRVEAEFLIDANGKVVNAFYGATPGDYLPINTVKEFIKS